MKIFLGVGLNFSAASSMYLLNNDALIFFLCFSELICWNYNKFVLISSPHIPIDRHYRNCFVCEVWVRSSILKIKLPINLSHLYILSFSVHVTHAFWFHVSHKIAKLFFINTFYELSINVGVAKFLSLLKTGQSNV